MRLSELDPELDGTLEAGAVWHDCPVCKGDAAHRVRTPVTRQPFHEVSYEVIRTRCWHGHISAGNVL